MHPVMVRIPFVNLPIYSYGVMLGLSLFVAWYIINYLGGKKENLDRELMSNCFMVTAISALVGSRILYIITNFEELPTPLDWIWISKGGLVAYGGFLGGYLGSHIYLWRKKVPLGVWADCAAPTLGSGLMLTRIGCYLYGCDFGERLPADAPDWLAWLGTFPHWHFPQNDPSGSPAFSHHVSTYGLSQSADASFPVHPTQLYESSVGLVLFGVAALVWRFRSFRGQVTLVLVMLYGTWRFFVETLRDDPERGALGGFSTSQIISMALVPIAVLAYVMVRKRKKDHGEPTIPESALAKPDTESTTAAAKGPSSVRRVWKTKK